MTTDTPILKNDFVPLVSEAARQLIIIDADGGSSLSLTPDNPKAGAVAFIRVAFDSERAKGSCRPDNSEECISLDYEATLALYEALGTLLLERSCGKVK